MWSKTTENNNKCKCKVVEVTDSFHTFCIYKKLWDKISYDLKMLGITV